MNKREILNLLDYPAEWAELEMYLEEVMAVQNSEVKYDALGSLIKPLDPEHYRAAAFYWWFKYSPSEEQVKNLIKLAMLDPDKPMGKAMVNEIKTKLIVKT